MAGSPSYQATTTTLSAVHYRRMTLRHVATATLPAVHYRRTTLRHSMSFQQNPC